MTHLTPADNYDLWVQQGKCPSIEFGSKENYIELCEAKDKGKDYWSLLEKYHARVTAK